MATSFEPIQFYELALHLKEYSLTDKEGASLRTGISRAYYSIFLSIRKKLTSMNRSKYFEDPDCSGGMHIKLIRHLQTSQVKEENVVGNSLEKLKKMRVSADYHLQEPITSKELDSAIQLSQAIRLYMNSKLHWE